MTAQGDRYFRYTQWSGIDTGSYDGNQIAAAEAITGETGLTADAALHRICASLLTDDYDPTRPLMDYMAAAAEALGVEGGWDSVGRELPPARPSWPPGGLTDPVYGVDEPNEDWVRFPDGTATPVAGQSIVITAQIYVIAHTGTNRNIASDAELPLSSSGVSVINWRFTVDNNNLANFVLIESPGIVRFATSTAALPTGQWLNVVADYNGTNMVVRVNGVPGTSVGCSPHQVNNPQPTWLIGGDGGTTFENAPAWNMQVRNVIVDLNNTKVIDAPCNEGSGLVCVNSVGDNGTISNERVHREAL